MTRRSADKPATAAKSAGKKAAQSGAKVVAPKAAKATTSKAAGKSKEAGAKRAIASVKAAKQTPPAVTAKTTAKGSAGSVSASARKTPPKATAKRGAKVPTAKALKPSPVRSAKSLKASAKTASARNVAAATTKTSQATKGARTQKLAAPATTVKRSAATTKDVATAKRASKKQAPGNQAPSNQAPGRTAGTKDGRQSKMTPKEVVKQPKAARAAAQGRSPAKGATRSAVAGADAAGSVARRWEEPFKEFSFKSQNAFLTVLVNRPAKRIRVIDFRAGAMPAKRLFIQTTARQEDIHKVQIFIEKDEISAWTKVGFQREGTVPGFYKRSDGYLCGFFPQGQGLRKEQLEQLTKESEKALVAAKRAAGSEVALPDVKVFHLDGDAARKFRDKATGLETAYAAFEPFARDADYLFVGAGPKPSAPMQVCGVEYEECFGHAQVDFLQRADSEAECAATAACMREVEAILTNKHIVSLYTYVPIDAIAWLGVLLDLGFRRTGLVPRGLTTLAGEGVDTLLMTKKLDFLDDD